jgi:hypothetical protein
MAATSGSRRVVIVGDGFADLFAAALVTGSQRQTFKRGQARQTRTTSANDRSHSLPPTQPARHRLHPPAPMSAAAPGEAGPSRHGGTPWQFSRRSGVTPRRDDS